MDNITAVWFGTQDEYDAVNERDKTTLYIMLTKTNNGSIGVI
jgi:hypothetical protein